MTEKSVSLKGPTSREFRVLMQVMLSLFFARQRECPYAHEIYLPMWVDSGSLPGHICDHRLMLWWLGAQTRLQSLAFIFDPRLTPGYRTKHSTAVPPLSHSKAWPPGCLRSCPHWEIKNICVFLFLEKKNHFENTALAQDSLESVAVCMPGLLAAL